MDFQVFVLNMNLGGKDDRLLFFLNGIMSCVLWDCCCLLFTILN